MRFLIICIVLILWFIHLTNSAIRSIITYIISISICRCSLMVKFELPKLASRVRFPSPAPCKGGANAPPFLLFIWNWTLDASYTIGEGANLGVSYQRWTPRKPLSRCVARSAAPKAALIAEYSLHLLHAKEVQMHLLFCYSFGIEPSTQAIQSERGRIWVYPIKGEHPENRCQGA